MLRGKTILTTAALLGVCAVPASAQEAQDLRSPDAKDAARAAQGVVTGPSQDLRPPDVRDGAEGRGPYAHDQGPYVLDRSYGSPDAADAARDLPPVQIPAPVVEVADSPGGFDWSDAGIGAAGTLGLLSIVVGSALLAGRRRRGGFRVAT